MHLEQRFEHINSLLEIFTNDAVCEVKRYVDQKETKLEANKWNGYSVNLHYPKVIPCTQEELGEELREAWPSSTQLWFKECNRALKEKVQPDQISTFSKFIGNYFWFFLQRQLIHLALKEATPSWRWFVVKEGTRLHQNTWRHSFFLQHWRYLQSPLRITKMK